VRSSEEYRNALRRMKKNVYIDGKLVERDDPLLRPSLNILSKTFDLAENPNFKDLIVTRSHLDGRPINRFTHINPPSPIW